MVSSLNFSLLAFNLLFKMSLKTAFESDLPKKSLKEIDEPFVASFLKYNKRLIILFLFLLKSNIFHYEFCSIKNMKKFLIIFFAVRKKINIGFQTHLMKIKCNFWINLWIYHIFLIRLKPFFVCERGTFRFCRVSNVEMFLLEILRFAMNLWCSLLHTYCLIFCWNCLRIIEDVDYLSIWRFFV